MMLERKFLDCIHRISRAMFFSLFLSIVSVCVYNNIVFIRESVYVLSILPGVIIVISSTYFISYVWACVKTNFRAKVRNKIPFQTWRWHVESGKGLLSYANFCRLIAKCRFTCGKWNLVADYPPRRRSPRLTVLKLMRNSRPGAPYRISRVMPYWPHQSSAFVTRFFSYTYMYAVQTP